MAIDKSIKPIIGMIVRNSHQELRTIKEVHSAHPGTDCLGKKHNASDKDHIWFTSETFTRIDDFYISYTLISNPEPLKEYKSRNRLDLIFED